MNTNNAADRDYNAMTDEDFRNEIRSWVEANYPEELRFPVHRLHHSETKFWYELLSAKGWLAPNWPKQYGGMGLDASKRIIFIEEFERFGCSRFNDQGVLMIGPLLMNYGTQEQRDLFLPAIISGEHIWAQGYSEPNAGSDLASLRTEAVIDGDGWVINGQKIWTSLGDDANWIYLLVRTDKAAKKQEGISFLLVPMDTPGITVRPINTLSMSKEFCEVFFDNVRVPKSALVGKMNDGWTMAKTLLGFERIFVGSPAQSSLAIEQLRQLADRYDVWTDPVFRKRFSELQLDLADHSTFYGTFIDKMRRGEAIGPEVSMLKIFQTELYKRITQTMVEIAGEEATLAEVPSNATVNPSALWIHSLGTTIYGGTSEVQRDIIAKQVLKLPS